MKMRSTPPRRDWVYMSREERTGWRDVEFSLRHRVWWGDDCPVVNIDSLGVPDGGGDPFNAVEYNRCRPVAIIEYKHCNAASYDENSANLLTLKNLAMMARLPMLVVRYWPHTWTMGVKRLNGRAMAAFGRDGLVTAHDYVMALYRLRGLELPYAVGSRLKGTIGFVAMLDWASRHERPAV